ncbi:DUF3653 domain-containing protein [Vibrio panuliri]
MHFYGDLGAAAVFLGRSESTIRRWCRCDTLPEWAHSMLRFKNYGSMRLHGDKWKHWKVDVDGLTTPNGNRITHKQLLAYSAWIDSNHFITSDAMAVMATKIKNTT